MSDAGEAALGERLRAIVAEILEMEVAEVDFDASFHDVLAVSSLEKVAIVSRMEAEFSVQLSDAEAASVDSLRGTIRLLAARGATGPGPA